MTTVLLTGAAGMIGTVVLRELEASGVTVWTTDRRDLDRDRHIVADLEDATDVARLGNINPDVTLHLSGAVSGDHDTLFGSNVVGTVRLLDSLSLGSRIVIAGSAAEYGTGTGEVITEATPLQPVSTYGCAKAAQTSAARSIASRRALRVTIVRPFNVYGPELPTTTALGNMARQLKSGTATTEITVGRLDVVRDYVPVEFVAAVFRAVAVDPAAPDVVNVCSGIGIELGDVLNAMIDLVGRQVSVIPDPRIFGAAAASSVVGNPQVTATRYGLEVRPDPGSVARAVLTDIIR